MDAERLRGSERLLESRYTHPGMNWNVAVLRHVGLELLAEVRELQGDNESLRARLFRAHDLLCGLHGLPRKSLMCWGNGRDDA